MSYFRNSSLVLGPIEITRPIFFIFCKGNVSIYLLIVFVLKNYSIVEEWVGITSSDVLNEVQRKTETSVCLATGEAHIVLRQAKHSIVDLSRPQTTYFG